LLGVVRIPVMGPTWTFGTDSIAYCAFLTSHLTTDPSSVPPYTAKGSETCEVRHVTREKGEGDKIEEEEEEEEEKEEEEVLGLVTTPPFLNPAGEKLLLELEDEKDDVCRGDSCC